MNKYLVTGGAGFLGSFIVKDLISRGHNPIVLLRESSSISRIAALVDYCKIIRHGNMSIEEHFEKEKPDYVIHTACNYGRKSEPRTLIVHDNLIYGLKIFEVAQYNNVKKFINIDSTLPKKLNAYSLAKFQFKEWLKTNTTKMGVFNFRIDHMYGENDDKNKFIYWFIKRCLEDNEVIELTDGSQRRDFIHARDVSNAILNVIELNDSHEGFHNFDLGSGKFITMKDFIILLSEIIKEIHGVNVANRLGWGKVSLRENDFKFPEMNIEWLKDYKWKPKRSLKEGLIKIVEEFK